MEEPKSPRDASSQRTGQPPWTQLTAMQAEPPELVLLVGGHGDVIQHTEAAQAVDGETAVVGHEGQRVPLQHQQPEAPQGPQGSHQPLQVC